jgi:tRNA wybutosine-synthesizing protein 3
MMSVEKEFLDAKEKALRMLEEACSEDAVDERILPILTMINNSKNYYTSSSCAGRIVVLEIPMIGDKKHAKFLGKWHRTTEPDEVVASVKHATTGLLWLLAQSPILHITTRSDEAADTLVKTAISSGFKNSGLKSAGKKILVEICSTERLDAPIGKDGVLLCSGAYLTLLVAIANEVIEKSLVKLQRFEEKLRNI